jgi:hypothetical protein
MSTSVSLPHGYTNRTTRHGPVVIKTYRVNQRIAATAMASRVAAVIGRNPLAIHWAALTARAV